MIDKINLNKKIILGSGSPRRKSLLEELGLKFSVKTIPVDEHFPQNMGVNQIAEHLAHKKADAFEQPEKDELIITADTVVAHNENLLAKPETKEEAYEMLKMLSGTTHRVVTGVCIREHNKHHIFHGITKVTFDQLSDELIWSYIKNNRPFDKAGAYGIQEWFGMAAVSHIEGSYFNVMGLPVHQLYNKLVEIVKL